MSSFHNMPIRHRLALAALIPVLGLIGVLAVQAMDLYAARNTADAVAQQTVLAPDISDAIHELQRERGMSVGHLASQGANFGDRLRSQRQATDAVLSELNGANVDGALASAVTEVKRQARVLPQLRERVDELAAQPGEAAAAYTEVVRAQIAALGAIGRTASASGQAALASAYMALVEAKERAGIERAIGAQGFGSQFALATHSRFLDLAARQAAYLNVFETNAPQAIRASSERPAARSDWSGGGGLAGGSRAGRLRQSGPSDGGRLVRRCDHTYRPHART